VDGDMTPVLTARPGWTEDLTAMRSEDEFPQNFKNYISWLESELETPIPIISIGPDRVQTVQRGEKLSV
jgi:adenylosuccinate synthase